jgi:3-oxoacyl-[acyl-carrier protein] reductase
VAVHYHKSEAEAASLVAELKARHVSVVRVQADVCDAAAVRAMADKVCRAFGRIDALINNAGIAQQKLFTDITEQDWDTMMDVNLGGVFRCCQAVLPGMISRKAGSIVNVSSIWGEVGASCEVHYCGAGEGDGGVAEGGHAAGHDWNTARRCRRDLLPRV